MPRPRPTEPAGAEPPPGVTEQIEAFSQSDEWREELTRDLLEQLVCCARIGGFRRGVAFACHVKPETLKWWLTEGLRRDAPALIRELSTRYQAAAAQINLVLTGCITNAAQRGEWMAAVAMLKVREPEDWGGTSPEEPLIAPDLSIQDRDEMLRQALMDENNPVTKLARKVFAEQATPATPPQPPGPVSGTPQR